MARRVTINDAIRLMDGALENAMKLSCTGVATEAQDGTPVLNGDARASWNPTIGEPVVDNILISEGETRRHDLAAVINDMKIGETFSYTNGIPYIKRLEFESWSAQNDLFTTKAIANWQATVDAAVAAARIL